MWSGGDARTILWSGNDADDDTLFYSVYYTADGLEWLPLASDIANTQVTVDPMQLPGGSSARVLVVVSDGINNARDLSDATFVVERKLPEVSITAPQDQALLPSHSVVLLRGFGHDKEDGSLLGSGLRWISSQDGILGTGSSVPARLSSGSHLITLAATDSDGNETRTMIHVFVGYRRYLPLVLKSYVSR